MSERERANLTRVEASKRIGISRASLEYYEKGQRTPDAGILYKMAKVYNTSVDYLLGIHINRNETKEEETLRITADFIGCNEETTKILKELYSTSNASFINYLTLIICSPALLKKIVEYSVQYEQEKMTSTELLHKAIETLVIAIPDIETNNDIIFDKGIIEDKEINNALSIYKKYECHSDNAQFLAHEIVRLIKLVLSRIDIDTVNINDEKSKAKKTLEKMLENKRNIDN